MKHTIRKSFGLTFATAMLIATPLFAQSVVKETVTTTTGTNSVGTISTFGPDTIVLRTTTSPDPSTYSYTKTTTYVDENGQPVSVETVKSGAPVTVYYDKVGDKMTANRVVVRKTIVTNP